MRSFLFPVILVLVLFAGCIESGVEKGDIAQYELPGLPNTTIYYMNDSSIKVVENVVNSTFTKINLGDTTDMAIKDPVAVDISGNKVDFNVSREAIFGKTFMRFDFNTSFTGYVAFSQSNDGEFSRQVMRNGSIHVVLPVNFTTGSKFLGIAIPEPDNTTIDTLGREVLIWNDPYPEYNLISVKYYQKSSPLMLFGFMSILLLCVLIVSCYYYFSIRALRKKRELMEKGIKK